MLTFPIGNIIVCILSSEIWQIRCHSRNNEYLCHKKKSQCWEHFIIQNFTICLWVHCALHNHHWSHTLVLETSPYHHSTITKFPGRYYTLVKVVPWVAGAPIHVYQTEIMRISTHDSILPISNALESSCDGPNSTRVSEFYSSSRYAAYVPLVFLNIKVGGPLFTMFQS